MLQHRVCYPRVDRPLPTTTGTHLTLAVDLSRPPVFLQGRVTAGPAFAAAMLALGRIVKSRARRPRRDHAAYRAWVHQRYLEELAPAEAAALARWLELRPRQQALTAEIKALHADIRQATRQLDSPQALKQFYDWLYHQNRPGNARRGAPQGATATGGRSAGHGAPDSPSASPGGFAAPQPAGQGAL